MSKHRVLIAGMLSPIAAVLCYAAVYGVLTERSADTEKDWLFRLCASAAAMVVPILLTLVFAIREHRSKRLSFSGKVGFTIALLSLVLVYKPVNDGIARWKQTRNAAMRDVPAPLFDTPDLLGNRRRLADYRGQVVLVNIWATWCAPCRAEMPALDRLYRERKSRGFVVLGMSNESISTQKKFLNEVSVSYPLLTLSGDVPSFYRDIARYPAMFLIDRRGRLQPVPAPGQPFEKIEASVDSALSQNSLR